MRKISINKFPLGKPTEGRYALRTTEAGISPNIAFALAAFITTGDSAVGLNLSVETDEVFGFIPEYLAGGIITRISGHTQSWGTVLERKVPS